MACGIIILVGFVLVRRSLSTETYATDYSINSAPFFIIVTSSPASTLLWFYSVNFLADRRLLIQFWVPVTNTGLSSRQDSLMIMGFGY